MKLRTLKKWVAALAGVFMLIIGGMLPTAIFIPSLAIPPKIAELPSSMQIPALLICAYTCGPSSGVIATAAYLVIGLFYLPVFHGGGSIGYLLTPDIGYLIGFIPAVWVAGKLFERKEKHSIIELTVYSFVGLFIIHSIGITNIIIGSLTNRWIISPMELIYTYSISPLPVQLLLSPGIALIAKFSRAILLT